MSIASEELLRTLSQRVVSLSGHVEILEGRVLALEHEAAQRRAIAGQSAETSRETLSINRTRPINGTR